MSNDSVFKTLDEFILYAEDYARFALQDAGQLAAAFVILTQNSSVLLLPANTDDEHAKSKSIEVGRLVCTAHAATAVVFMAEAWMSS